MLSAEQIDAMRHKLVVDIGFYEHAKRQFSSGLADDIYYDDIIRRLQGLLEKEY